MTFATGIVLVSLFATACVSSKLELAQNDPSPLGAPSAPPADAGPQKYTCPMHPEIVKDEPGNCPICHMKLVPQKDKH
jgi:hypothetical protein